MNEEDFKNLSLNVSTVFSPAAPINEQELFAGRIEQLRKVADVIHQKGQHAVIFGERGVGKTSLANIISVIFRTENFTSLKTNCDTSDTFETVWRKVFTQIKISKKDYSMVFGKPPQAELFDFAEYFETLNPERVRQTLLMLTENNVLLIVIDEFDRITDQQTKTLFADTIKTLSDQCINSTIVLVGVADSVDELINQHLSVERALVQIRMPRMKQKELNEIFDKGLPKLGMTIDDDAKRYITHLSQGLAHYTHLMGLHSARQALDEKSNNITLKHVKQAIHLSIAEAQQSIRSAYHKATMSPRKDNIFRQVLLACALAKTDDLGYFAPADIKGPLSKIMGKNYDIGSFSRHLNDFCESGRGPVLQKTGAKRRFRFRFINPLMQPYVTMNGFDSGLLKEGFIVLDIEK
jgi:Cdc6-like AAA superfamily ATPase